MAEQLDSLLEKIKRDGVDKARVEAERIITDAEQKAERILKEAEAGAEARREAAEKAGAAYAERARTSVAQAARDVILSVGSALSNAALDVARRETTAALSGAALGGLIKTVVEAYARDGASVGIDVLLNAQQKKQVADFLMANLAESVRKGVTLRDDAGIVAGFRVSIPDKQVEHDFTGEAIAEALAGLLRPELGEIVRSAVR
jgi:V/A-type H+-transporting ATPase subunit E